MSYSSIGTVIYGAAQWGIFITIAKAAGPASAGEFALALAITAPLVLLVNLQLAGLLATDVRGDHRFGHYLALRLTALAAGAAAMVFGVLLLHFRGQTSEVLVVVGATKIVDAVSDLVFGLLQREECMPAVGAGLSLNGLGSFALVVVTASLTHNVLPMVVASGLGSILALAINLLNARRLRGYAVAEGLRPEFAWGRLLLLARTAAPLGIVMLLISLIVNVPRYFLAHYSGHIELGAFVAMTYSWMVGLTLVGAAGQCCAPRLAREYSAGRVNAFVWLLTVLLGFAATIGFTIVAIVALAGHGLLGVVYRADYRDGAGVFLIVALAGALSMMASVLGYGMTAARQLDVQVPLSILVLAVVVVGSALLVPSQGLRGAAWAVVAANSVQLATCAVAVIRAATREPTVG